jgi:hypothetical protein
MSKPILPLAALLILGCGDKAAEPDDTAGGEEADTDTDTDTDTDADTDADTDTDTDTDTEPNTAPTIVVTNPADGSSASVGEPMIYTATVWDAEQELSELIVTFQSSLDGTFCTPEAEDETGYAECTASLGVGEHVLWFEVTDDRGLSANEVLLFEITPWDTGGPDDTGSGPDDTGSGPDDTGSTPDTGSPPVIIDDTGSEVDDPVETPPAPPSSTSASSALGSLIRAVAAFLGR